MIVPQHQACDVGAERRRESRNTVVKFIARLSDVPVNLNTQLPNTNHGTSDKLLHVLRCVSHAMAFWVNSIFALHSEWFLLGQREFTGTAMVG